MDREHLERIRDLFRKAEHRIKYVESLQGRLNIPSINHLRYVSFHVLNYVLDGEAAELNEAEHHASRALFDTYEIEVLFFLDLFRRFQNDYSNHPITDVIPQYLEWQDQCTAARDFIAAHGQAPNREGFEPPLGCPKPDFESKSNALIPRSSSQNSSAIRYARSVALARCSSWNTGLCGQAIATAR